jgi:signal transduction histidine kinase
MNGFSRLAFVETKLFLREKAATLAVFGLPVALVIGFGLIPGFGQPQKSLSDQIGTEYIASLGVAIVLATLGLNGVPMVIGQYRIVTQLEAARQTSNDAERERRIDNAKRLARDSLAEARRSVQALRPQALENSKLPDALAEEVARWSATSGVPGEVETTGDARALHPEVEVTLLRVAQEALANVAKHAAASRAGVTLSYMEDVVSLDVRDDGAGFVPNGHAEQSSVGGGFGLVAMRQRVSRLAGQLEIESEPGAGTAVSASLPAIPLGPSPQATKAEESN